MMPCLNTCPDGVHWCIFAVDHPGDHAAPGCIWPTEPSKDTP